MVVAKMKVELANGQWLTCHEVSGGRTLLAWFSVGFPYNINIGRVMRYAGKIQCLITTS